MGRGRERRQAAAADRAAEEEALRRGIDEVLRVKDEGNLEAAAGLAMKLVDSHPKCATAYNLVGFITECAAENIKAQVDLFPDLHPARLGPGDGAGEISRGYQFDCFTPEDLIRFGGGESDGVLEEEHASRAKQKADAMDDLAVYLKTCAEWYRKAAMLAPRCVFTRTRCAKYLEMTDQNAAAYQDFHHALNIRTPDLPQKNNPWVPYNDHEEMKARATKDYHYFLHQMDTRVYKACCDILVSVQNGITVQGRKEAKALQDEYPFSCRANLLHPFLTRALIEASTSSASKLRAYQKLIHDIAETMDAFPSSLVLSLFRAEVLYSMGHYLEAARECIRALGIRRPDDPVSQDVPPGWASGAGPTARIATAVAKIVGLMELIEKTEIISNPKDIKKVLQGLRLESIDAPAAKDRCKHLLDNLNSKLMEHEPKKACEQDSIAAKKTSKHPSRKLKDQRHKRDKNDETECMQTPGVMKEDMELAIRPHQVMDTKIVSRESVDKYAEYCYLRSLCSVKKNICHLCVFEEDEYYTNIIPDGSMIYHCVHVHKTSTIECAVSTCGVRFRSEEDRELHQHYCHFLDNDWWIQWRHR